MARSDIVALVLILEQQIMRSNACQKLAPTLLFHTENET